MLCPVCLSVAKQVVKTACGHIYCRHCLVASLLIKNECPLDRQPIRREEVLRGVFDDVELNAQIQDLPVRCSAARCHWTGLLKDLHDHVQLRCDYEPCSFEKYGCKVRRMRKESISLTASLLPPLSSPSELPLLSSVVASSSSSSSSSAASSASPLAHTVLSPDVEPLSLLEKIDELHEHSHFQMLEESQSQNTNHINRLSEQVALLTHHFNAVYGYLKGFQERDVATARQLAELDVFLARDRRRKRNWLFLATLVFFGNIGFLGSRWIIQRYPNLLGRVSGRR